MLTKSEITRLKHEYDERLVDLRADHDREWICGSNESEISWSETKYDTANDIVEEYLVRIMPSAVPSVRKTHRVRAVKLIMGEGE